MNLKISYCIVWVDAILSLKIGFVKSQVEPVSQMVMPWVKTNMTIFTRVYMNVRIWKLSWILECIQFWVSIIRV